MMVMVSCNHVLGNQVVIQCKQIIQDLVVVYGLVVQDNTSVRESGCILQTSARHWDVASYKEQILDTVMWHLIKNKF